MGVPPNELRSRLRDEIERRPRVTGGNVDVRIGNDLRSVLDGAEKEMAKLKDEFVSAEHYLLALANSKCPRGAERCKSFGVTRDKLMQALQQVRGSQRVTDQNPEGKYQTLEKYGRDLTELARRGKDRSGDRPRQRNPPRHAGALAPHEKQSGADRRAGRRQDGDRRRPRAADHYRRRAGVAQEQAAHRDGHRRDGRRRKVSRRIRGSAEGVPERGHRLAGRDHSVHRRAAHHRRRGRGRRLGRRVESAQAAARARRAAHDRRDDARRVSQVHREGRRARAALPAGDGG